MRVIITKYAEASLQGIYDYKVGYSLQHAGEFFDNIIDFVIDNLSVYPRLGHVYNEEKSLFRLIYQKRYNIYYVIRDERIYVLYIIDGQIELNSFLADPDVELPNID